MNMFRKGNRVTYKATGDTGTVTRKRGDVVRVQWDDGIETPVHPLELAHTEKDRSASDQEIAAAPTNNPSDKESAMTNITDYATIDLVAEAERRGMQVPANLRAETPPAGFKLEYHCACGSECPPDDQIDEYCSTIGHSYNGPGVYLDNSNANLSSHWTAKHGITFHLSNYKCQNDDGNWTETGWTRDELAQLPNMVSNVLSQIDYAEAKAFFERFPEPFEGTPTVTELITLAHDNNLSAPETFQAYMDLTKGRTNA